MGNFKRTIALCENALNAVDGENTTVFGDDDDEDDVWPLPTDDDDADEVDDVELVAMRVADDNGAALIPTLPTPTTSAAAVGRDELDEAQDAADEEENAFCCCCCCC